MRRAQWSTPSAQRAEPRLQRPLLLGARTLLVAPGLTTSNKNAIRVEAIAIRNEPRRALRRALRFEVRKTRVL